MSNFPLFTKYFEDIGFSLFYKEESKNHIFYRGVISTEKGEISIEFCFIDKHLTSFPKAFILNKNISEIKPFHFPHVDAKWQLCFDDGVKVFDKYRPKDMVKYCVERVIYVINSTLSNDMDEITREFIIYWQPDKIYYGNIQSNSYSLIIGETEITGISKENFSRSKSQNQFIPIFRIPKLPKYTNIDWPIDNFKNLKLWLKDVNNFDFEIIKYIKRKISEYEKIFIVVFYSEKEKYFFGFQCETNSLLMKKKGKQYLQDYTVENIFNNEFYLKNRFWISNNTPSDLIASNSESLLNLIGKNILLIGAGTIGSNLSNMLVRNGIGIGTQSSLTIIDNDVFEPCNFSRHFLGLNSIGLPKAEALGDELKRIAPFSEIKAINESVYTSSVFSQNFDLIIDTTGEESLSMWLHEFLNDKETLVISTWVRGRGEAVEAFVRKNKNNGCHQCFRLSDSRIKYSGGEFPLRGSCGSVYVPFSISESLYASLLTMEIINKWLNGTLDSNFFRQNLNPIGEIEALKIEKEEKCTVCGTNYTME